MLIVPLGAFKHSLHVQLTRRLAQYPVVTARNPAQTGTVARTRPHSVPTSKTPEAAVDVVAADALELMVTKWPIQLCYERHMEVVRASISTQNQESRSTPHVARYIKLE